MSPYKVLGVNPGATKEEIKDAYNKMVKKYHPDKYQEKHMKELAEQKMKEINEAYDLLTKHNGSYNNSYSGTNGNSGTSGSNGNYYDVRSLIQSGRFVEARQILEAMDARDAEWFFLMGIVEMNTGNYSRGSSFLGQAVNRDPNNAEYRQAYNQAMGGTIFSRRAGHARTRSDMDTCCQVCGTLWCMDCCCEMSGGDLITCC